MISSKLTLTHWLSLITIVFLIVFGALVLISDWFESVLPGWKKWAFGSVTIIYAIIRLNRIKKQIQS
jgi:membrane protein YdbS with pleckstrin-like domain